MKTPCLTLPLLKTSLLFNVLLGLKINLEKRELFPIGRVGDAEVLIGELGCRFGCLPSTDQGLPPGARYKLVQAWDGIEVRFKRRKTIWKRKYICKGGRATLIKNTLWSLPIYFLSLFRLPSIVSLRLDQI